MKVWYNGSNIDMEIGQNATIVRCGSGKTIFGESAKLERITKQHLIFVTESGATVKTDLNNIHKVIGLAKQNGYVVSPKPIENLENIIVEKTMFWDSKKCYFINR